MTAFVDSLKRLYESGKIPELYINVFKKDKKITEEEHQYILGKDGK